MCSEDLLRLPPKCMHPLKQSPPPNEVTQDRLVSKCAAPGLPPSLQFRDATCTAPHQIWQFPSFFGVPPMVSLSKQGVTGANQASGD